MARPDEKNIVMLSERNSPLIRKLKDEQNRFLKTAARSELVNMESVDWLTRRAVENLDESTIRSDGSGELHALLQDPQKHSRYTSAGFRFAMQSLMDRRNKYWRVVEEGTTYWVGKLVRLKITGDEHEEGQAAGGGRITRYTPPRKYPDVGSMYLIKTPIYAHNYLRDAVRRFEQDDIYNDYLDRHFGDMPAYTRRRYGN